LETIMNIKTERDITPEAARHLRKEAGLTQRDFWESVGSSQASGHWFETGKRHAIPKPIRMLVFLVYVAKLNFDVSRPEEADAVVHLGHEIAARKEAARLERESKEAAERAKIASQQARKVKL
jgi:transcriptional regulator with XRE-family HTH domain